ncbi:hypothetical protein ACFL0V_01395 [Nanoarchaeota archaeon]
MAEVAEGSVLSPEPKVAGEIKMGLVGPCSYIEADDYILGVLALQEIIPRSWEVRPLSYPETIERLVGVDIGNLAFDTCSTFYGRRNAGYFIEVNQQYYGVSAPSQSVRTRGPPLEGVISNGLYTSFYGGPVEEAIFEGHLVVSKSKIYTKTREEPVRFLVR